MSKTDKKALNQLIKKHNLSFLLMHGSQVSGKTHKMSDIDIAFYPLDRNFNLLELVNDLSSCFNSNRLDVSNVRGSNPLFTYNVARTSQLVAGSITKYKKFCRDAFFAYCDYKPYLEREEAFVRKKNKLYVTS